MKSQILIIFLFLALALWGAGCDKNKNPTSAEEEPINEKNTPPDIQYVTHPQVDIPWPTLANSPCPIANYNPQRVARSKYTGPKKGKVKWTLDMGGKATYAPVVGTDRTIYVTARRMESQGGYRMFAVSPEGQIKWVFIPSPARDIQTSPIITSDNTILLATHKTLKFDSTAAPGILFALNSDGSVQWQKDLPIRVACRGGLIDLQGNIYYVGNDGEKSYLYSFSGTGDERWKISSDDYFHSYSYPSLSPDGSTIYLRVGETNFYSINSADGSINWQQTSAKGYSALIVDNMSNVYTYYRTSTEYGIVSYDRQGNERWKYNFYAELYKRFHSQSEFSSEMCLNYNGYIYSLWGTKLFSCDYTGQKRWLTELSTDSSGEPAVTCDADSVIYAASGEYLFAYDQNGEQLFKCKFTDNSNAYAGSLACDGVAYLLDPIGILAAVY